MARIVPLKGLRELSGSLALSLALPEPHGSLPGLGVSQRVRVLSRCLVPREGTVSPGMAPEPLRVLPGSGSLLSPHCPLVPAGIFIALLLRFDIR